jgi:hypothetical protein
MVNFKGFDDWIAIFKGGPQTDSKGQVRDGDALMDKAITTFDPAHHEPPLVVGHPKDNSPAFGWVAGLKKAGSVLYAKFKDVVPEFENLVKGGSYKKRSAAFYPDGRLRHVGFLGAVPPAVKGLADLKFEDGQEAVSFEFEEPIAVATLFTEADLEAIRQEERKKTEAEFAEKARQDKREARKKEVLAWCDAKVREGRLTPGLVKYGVPEMLCFLADTDAVIEFGDEYTPRATAHDWLKGLFERELPRLITFEEIATRDNDFQRGEASEKLVELIKKKMRENEGMSYGAAFTEVQKEHPDLAEECRQEITG